jgi:hypothetical protein
MSCAIEISEKRRPFVSESTDSGLNALLTRAGPKRDQAERSCRALEIQPGIRFVTKPQPRKIKLGFSGESRTCLIVMNGTLLRAGKARQSPYHQPAASQGAGTAFYLSNRLGESRARGSQVRLFESDCAKHSQGKHTERVPKHVIGLLDPFKTSKA